jgi:hypothetical protein
MLHRNSSAGTAAKKSYKCSLIQRPAIILAMLLLCAVFSASGQNISVGRKSMLDITTGTASGPFGYQDTSTSIDTVKVVLLVADTSHRYSEYMQFQSCEDVGCKDTTEKHKMFISHYKNIKEDESNYGSGQTYWTYGYSVRRKECCINGNTGNLAYYQPIPYYTHLLYLDDKKQPLKSTVIVWQSVSAK